MEQLLLALFVFLASHVLVAARPVRSVLSGLVGERPYLIIYSLLSIALLIWLGFAFAAAPHVELWAYDERWRLLPMAVMPLACILFAAGLASRNPFSLGAGGQGFDAARPGIVRLTRHPVPAGLALWSLSHIPINGDAAALLLFGLLSLLSLAGPRRLDAKRRARLGDAAWRDLIHQVQQVPVATALLQVGLLRLAGGVVLYAALIWAHEPVIGVAPVDF